MAVPFLDIASQYKSVQADLEKALLEVARSGKYILGERGAALEKKLAEYVDVPYAVGCASGTDALILSLRALGVGPGDEVITTAYSFFSTASCIALVGATPVFVDIDPRTYNIDPRGVEKKLSIRTKAVIPVHLYGQPAEMEPLLALSKEWGVKIIEDACQSLGADYKGRRVGSLGDVGCVSFYPTKNLSGMGDGGMIFTRSPAIAERLRSLREHGAKTRYVHTMVGYNSRLDELQAAVVLVKARLLEEWTEKRRANAKFYSELFMGSAVGAPYDLPYVRHVYNQYVIRVADRDTLMEHLRSKGIGCAVYYPVPLHLQECFKTLGYIKGSMPVSEKASGETLALPIYPELSGEQMGEVARELVSFYR
ncbi:MAG: DegT/DnrJ/EryC1/StrS family aminotransferase [Candidatus Aureabacteria bacterium]|nr:DegT/DnrJ/EryC1/StrS family aminotransferase [Candidatus Auribacterota bacterium]